MAIIKPFKGIRPPQDLVEQVASRPYDVLNSAEAREEAKGNEKSLYHIIKPEIDFPVGTDEHDECVYQKAAENFQMFQDKGWLVQDDKENYYVYAQTMNGKTQYGLVVGAYVPDYMNGVIKKHELTRRDKEEDRMKHVRVNNANIEPVFFAYPDNATLDAIIAHYTAGKPVYDFIAPGDGFGHTFWIVDKTIENRHHGTKVNFVVLNEFLKVFTLHGRNYTRKKLMQFAVRFIVQKGPEVLGFNSSNVYTLVVKFSDKIKDTVTDSINRHTQLVGIVFALLHFFLINIGIKQIRDLFTAIKLAGCNT